MEEAKQWVALQLGPIADKQMLPFEVAGMELCMARFDGKLFAFPRKCPHAGVFMDEGYIDSRGAVVCPLHGYKFTLKNGYNCSGEGYKMKTFAVEERPDGVYIAL
jgi:nitrite reductase/ring-hydroxylating ferredoxin subunit